MKTKPYITLVIFLSTLIACNNKPEPKLELSNPEAFAFNIENSWEVNSSVNAKGFLKKELNNGFSSKLFYTVNLITPAQDTIKKIFTDTLASFQKNDFNDVQIEAQMEMDSSFAKGNYKLIFIVNDMYSKQKKYTEVNFSLSN